MVILLTRVSIECVNFGIIIKSTIKIAIIIAETRYKEKPSPKTIPCFLIFSLSSFLSLLIIIYAIPIYNLYQHPYRIHDIVLRCAPVHNCAVNAVYVHHS